jgi:hypothetical protein
VEGSRGGSCSGAVFLCMATTTETRTIAINRAIAIVASFRPVFGFPAIIVLYSGAEAGVFSLAESVLRIGHECALDSAVVCPFHLLSCGNPKIRIIGIVNLAASSIDCWQALDNPPITVRSEIAETHGTDRRFRFDRVPQDQAHAPAHPDFREGPEVPGSEAVRARKEFEAGIRNG